MSSHLDWRSILLKVASDRGITSPAIAAALHNVQDDPCTASWVERNLVQSQPLTLEELAIWHSIGGSSVHIHPEISPRVQGQVLLTEEALEEAIQELEQSSRSINANVHALESQTNLILSTQEPSYGPTSTTGAFESGLTRKTAAQSQQLTFVNRDLVSELEGKLQLLRDGTDRHRKAVNSTVTQKLRTDDRVLSALETALTKSHIDIQNSTTTSDKIKSLIAVLRYITVQWLKTRLDRVYLQELTTTNLPSDNDESISDDTLQIEHDLQSLYTEIEDVASMLMENEYGNELKNLASEISSHTAKTRTDETYEVSNKLESATQSLDLLAQRYECLQAHRQILDHLDRSLAQTKTKSATTSSLSRPVHIRHSSAGRIDRATDRSDRLDALLRHMNIDGTREILSDSPATHGALERHSKATAQQNRDLVQALVATAQTSTVAAQTRLQRLEHGGFTDQLERAAERINELDEQIAVARGEVDRVAETRYQEGCADLARRFAEKQ